jgi:hypothetical protein
LQSYDRNRSLPSPFLPTQNVTYAYICKIREEKKILEDANSFKLKLLSVRRTGKRGGEAEAEARARARARVKGCTAPFPPFFSLLFSSFSFL